MKARFSYPLLFLVPSVMVSALVAILAVGAGAGILWIFVFGDDPWPEVAETWLLGLLISVFTLVLTALVWASYEFGKRQEPLDGLAGKHIVIAIAVTILLPALVLLRQWRIGALGS